MLFLAIFAGVTLGVDEKPLDDIEFIRVAGSEYTVGEEGHPRNPSRKVAIGTFEIATTEVTNAQFARFVEATGYVTDSERSGFGMTFKEGMVDWEWHPTPGATWRSPWPSPRWGE